MRYKGFCIAIACLFCLTACSAAEEGGVSSVTTGQTTTAASFAESEESSDESAETTDSGASFGEVESAAEVTSEADLSEAESEAEEGISQTSPDTLPVCSELGEGQIVLILWKTRNVDLDRRDLFDVSGRYITSDGALYEFRIDSVDYSGNDAARGGAYLLEEEYLPVIGEYSELIGYADTDALDELYEKVKASDTDDVDVDSGLFFGEKEELAYSISVDMTSDMVFVETGFVYCYTLCDGGSLLTEGDRFDIIREQDGVRKMLLHGTYFNETVSCSKRFDHRAVLFPESD